MAPIAWFKNVSILWLSQNIHSHYHIRAGYFVRKIENDFHIDYP
jgi:hypothetical protein